MRVYKVISRRIIKHLEMILEIFYDGAWLHLTHFSLPFVPFQLRREKSVEVFTSLFTLYRTLRRGYIIMMVNDSKVVYCREGYLFVV